MLHIDLARLSDLDTIYAIQQESFRALYEKYRDPESPYKETRERLEHKMLRPLTSHYLIYLNGQPIGFSRVKLNENQKEAWLGTTAILPAFQRKGYAYEAIQLIEAEHPQITHWSLDTILQEAHLVRLYKQLGYRVYKTEPLQKGMDLVFMEKEC